MAKKSTYRDENRILAELLRDVRYRAGFTQVELTERLHMAQTYASEAERSIRRLDLVQIRDWCIACEVDLRDFVVEFEGRLGDPEFQEPRETDGRRRRF